MTILYNSQGNHFELEEWLENLLNRIICGWYSTDCQITSVKNKTDIMMVVRCLRNVCNMNQWRDHSWNIYCVPALTEDQTTIIREQFMPFLKNSDRLLSRLEVK